MFFCVRSLEILVYINVMNDELLYKYFRNEASEDEMREILAWLEESPEHQKEFDSAHMLFNMLALNEFRITSDLKQKKDSKRRTVRIFRAVAGVAASVAVILSIGIGGGVFLGKKELYRELSAQSNVMKVPAGHRLTMTLQDGTVVHLNGGSCLEYPTVFAGDRRGVKLSGEAFLEVSHDAAHPFVVHTFASEIEVLGTEFNVYADEEERFFSTTLLSGKVKVTTSNNDCKEHVILNPDETVRYIDNHLVVSGISARDAVSWTKGYINLQDAGFCDLMKRFENTFGVRIEIKRSDIPVVGYKSGKIRVSEGIDFALKILQEACDFKYEKNSETGVITIL